jgi:predicted permease
MSVLSLTIKQVTMMALMLLIGVYCYKKKYCDNEQSKALSSILMNVINPLVLFQSFQTNLTPELLKSLAGSFLLNAISLAVLILVAPLLLKKKNNPVFNLESVAFIYSNSGFVAIPIANAIWGAQGVIYITPYLTVSNLYFWTHAYMTVSEQKLNPKNVFKCLTSPILIGIYAGIFCMVTGFRLPAFLNDTISGFSSMNTPLAMMIAGMSMAQVDLKKTLTKLRVYYVTLLRLLVAPFITTLLALPFFYLGFDPLMLAAHCMTVGCPCAASFVILAIQFQKDDAYCSELFSVSTVLSGITIPLVVYLTKILFF